MSLIFEAKTTKEFNAMDNSLKLGRMYLNSNLMPTPDIIKQYKNLKKELRQIDGLKVVCIDEKASFNFPKYSIRLENSKINDEEALQEIMQQLSVLSRKKIGKQLINTISQFTDCKVPEQLDSDASQSCCIIA